MATEKYEGPERRENYISTRRVFRVFFVTWGIFFLMVVGLYIQARQDGEEARTAIQQEGIRADGSLCNAINNDRQNILDYIESQIRTSNQRLDELFANNPQLLEVYRRANEQAIARAREEFGPVPCAQIIEAESQQEGT